MNYSHIRYLKKLLEVQQCLYFYFKCTTIRNLTMYILNKYYLS